MKYSKSNAMTMAIVFAVCTLTAIALGMLIRFNLGSGDETVEKSKEENDSTADLYRIK